MNNSIKAIIVLAGFLFSFSIFSAENLFEKNYQQQSPDGFKSFSKEPDTKITRGWDRKTDITKMLEKGYDLMGYSGFTSLNLPHSLAVDFGKKIKSDFCINIRSMMEMNTDSINKYFKYIQENLSEDGYFLNVNRYFTDGNKYNFYFYNFPYDKNWLIIKNKTTWLQKNIHFLLTRKNNVALDDVGNLLKKLKDFTINRYLYRNNIYYKIKIFLKNLFK